MLPAQAEGTTMATQALPRVLDLTPHMALPTTAQATCSWQSTATVTSVVGQLDHRLVSGSMPNGDGGPASSGRLNRPTDVAIATDGSLLIAEQAGPHVRHVDAAGTITTIAGTTAGYAGDGSSALQAHFDFPNGTAAGVNGKVYIADAHNGRIRVLTC